MRIRSIKPEFWRSRAISSLSVEDRLLFIGLWSYVDDNGVGIDRVSNIAADLFADDLEADPRETFARVSRGLQQLSAASRIIRYEVDGHPYLEVVGWDEHQRIDRPAKPRYPQSSNDSAIIRDTLARVAGNVATGTGEQGNRGTGEQGNRGDASHPSSEVADAPIRPEIESLLDHLDNQIRVNGAKVPARTKKNIDAARLLLDRDGHSVEQVMRAIDFATSDEFWRTNVLSMSKLRQQYDALRLAAQRRPRPTLAKRTTDDRVRDGMDLARRLAAEDATDNPVLEIGA